VRSPFARKRKTPLDQAFDALDNVRVDAAGIAASVRDAASKAADVLGDAAPEVRGRRLPLIGVVAAAGIAVALVVRSRRDESADAPPPAPYTPPSVETAAKSTATATAPPAGAPDATEPRPAAKTESEEPKERRAETAESEAAK